MMRRNTITFRRPRAPIDPPKRLLARGGSVSSRNREFVVRFAVGDDKRGVRSSVWRIWKGRNKDDIYVAPRPVAGNVEPLIPPAKPGNSPRP
jgi:hypothetical protein